MLLLPVKVGDGKLMPDGRGVAADAAGENHILGAAFSDDSFSSHDIALHDKGDDTIDVVGAV